MHRLLARVLRERDQLNSSTRADHPPRGGPGRSTADPRRDGLAAARCRRRADRSDRRGVDRAERRFSHHRLRAWSPNCWAIGPGPSGTSPPPPTSPAQSCWARPSSPTRERVLGPDHPDTLTTRNNLAGAYRVGRAADRRHPPVRADPRRPRAGPRPRPPGHPDHPQQPRRRLPGRRAADRGHPPVRADPHRPRAGARPRPPGHPDQPQQPRRRLPGRRAAGPRPSPCTSRPSPTASGSSAPTTRTP